MEEAPENGKESPHSAHANGLIDWLIDIGSTTLKSSTSSVSVHSDRFMECNKWNEMKEIGSCRGLLKNMTAQHRTMYKLQHLWWLNSMRFPGGCSHIRWWNSSTKQFSMLSVWFTKWHSSDLLQWRTGVLPNNY
jgi:hypothetical protein